MSEYHPEIEEEVSSETQDEVEEPPLYKVLLHNDDYTTMEFVVMILMNIFHHQENQAVQITLQVHQKGVGVAGVYSYEIAETKVKKVIELARQNEYPLHCTMEQA